LCLIVLLHHCSKMPFVFISLSLTILRVSGGKRTSSLFKKKLTFNWQTIVSILGVYMKLPYMYTFGNEQISLINISTTLHAFHFFLVTSCFIFFGGTGAWI
jgi:hypothetical protein